MHRALFLDRDGIFNALVEREGVLTSPRNWNEVRLYPGLEGLADIKAMGYVLVLVTNQPCVEAGTVTETFLESMHEYLRRAHNLDGIYFSPSASNHHPRRKPNPGMLLEAALRFGISLPDSFVLGDTQKDIGAARNGGCQSILWTRPYNRHLVADYRIDSLWEAHGILKRSLEEAGAEEPR
jgi:D-glycero-D-manno-heptose 1,7-bisphosphate phosphatase